MPKWAKAVAPHAERVAHEFGRAVVGKWEPRTPLTGRKAKASAAMVRTRKADVVARVQKANAARAQNQVGELAAFAQCVDCGEPLARPQHVRCSTCWEKQPGQTREVRQRRGRAISEARTAQEQWKRDNPEAICDEKEFRRRVLPRLGASRWPRSWLPPDARNRRHGRTDRGERRHIPCTGSRYSACWSSSVAGSRMVKTQLSWSLGDCNLTASRVT